MTYGTTSSTLNVMLSYTYSTKATRVAELSQILKGLGKRRRTMYNSSVELYFVYIYN